MTWMNPNGTYVLDVRVGALRCFGPNQHLSLRGRDGLPAQWTVLLGDNGVGKTTLLQSIGALATTKNPPVPGRAVPERPGAFHLLKIAPFREGFGSAEGFVVFSNREVGGFSITPPGGMAYPSTPEKFVCFGYGAGRRIGREKINFEGDYWGCSTLFDENSKLINAEDWLIQTDYESIKYGKEMSNLAAKNEKIFAALENLLPDVDEIKIGYTKRKGAHLQLHTPYGWSDLDNLSHGYRTLIAWIVDLVFGLFRHYPESENPLAEPCVVLIDEVDLHMHPRWQRRFMLHLSERFPSAQFIATAHSPLVVQAAADANLAVLRREGSHVVIDNDPNVVAGWRVDQILTSEMFGISSPHSIETERKLQERRRLINKKRLTKKEESRLEELDKFVNELPSSSRIGDTKAMDLILRIAASHNQESR